MNSKKDRDFWRKYFMDTELKPGLRQLTSSENIEKWKEEHPDSKYIYINVEETLKQSEEQGIIKIIGSEEDWSTYRVIYKDVEIPYSTFWHSVQSVMLDAGFEHVEKAVYRFDVNYPPKIEIGINK
ncbi:hypothetical protein KAX97_08170 [candidate division WOR-3 bacterium]|nr:hypothetical protein [candidate division WOR-3 bacterium]